MDGDSSELEKLLTRTRVARGNISGYESCSMEPPVVIRSSDIRSHGGSTVRHPSAQEVVARTGGRESYLKGVD